MQRAPAPARRKPICDPSRARPHASGSLMLDSSARFLVHRSLPQLAATDIILAVGIAFPILTGGMDLSVWCGQAVSCIALGQHLRPERAPFLTWIMPLGMGVGFRGSR